MFTREYAEYAWEVEEVSPAQLLNYYPTTYIYVVDYSKKKTKSIASFDAVAFV